MEVLKGLQTGIIYWAEKCTYSWNFQKIRKPVFSEEVLLCETEEKQKCLKNRQNHHKRSSSSP